MSAALEGPTHRVRTFLPRFMRSGDAVLEIPVDHIPLVDNHCHGFLLEPPIGKEAWRRRFTESTDPVIIDRHVPTMLFYQRLIGELAGLFGCDPEEDAVLEARAKRPGVELIPSLLTEAGIETLLIDQGFPPAKDLYPDAKISALSGIPTLPLLRVELLMEELIMAEASLEAVEERLHHELGDIRRKGYVGLKSIVAYRTGLGVTRWPREEVEGAFQAAREEGLRAGRLRLDHKPLLDHLLLAAFREASRQEVPVQFHTGYGDTDTDLRLGDPLLLRWVLEEPEFKAMPVVLLHESYPFTRQSGYLSAVYGQVYTSLAFACPFIGFEDMVAFTREALGVAPASKILYESDAVGLPELHWASARHGRRVVSRVLGGSVEAREITTGMAEKMARCILHDNAVELYGL